MCTHWTDSFESVIHPGSFKGVFLTDTVDTVFIPDSYESIKRRECKRKAWIVEIAYFSTQ